jgi:uncharacterized LabA/DUF88 family protein
MMQQNTFKLEVPKNAIQIPGMASRGNAGIPNPNKNTIFFIDANNWYHNIKKYYDPSEIDIIKVVKFLCEVKSYKTKEVRFYSSIPSIEDSEKVYYNHIAYLDSLRKNGVHVITRKLQKLSNEEITKKKQRILNNLDLCENCRPLVEANFLDLEGIKRKEKGIDVWIAVDMLRLSTIENECDACVLISGDADFVPALEIITKKGKEVLTVMTPLGYSRELIEKFPYFLLKKETLIRFFRDYKGKTIK